MHLIRLNHEGIRRADAFEQDVSVARDACGIVADMAAQIERIEGRLAHAACPLREGDPHAGFLVERIVGQCRI